jgi:serine protease AprX
VLGGRVTATYNNFNMRSIDVPVAGILQLAASLQVSYISLDRPVGLLGHLSATSGADAVSASSGSNAGLDGTGIGIAVLDSGIYTAHRSFLGKNNNIRVVVSKDFTGEGRTDDPYGHGSHVASIAAGNGRVSNGAYLGIAPNASLINLRVLNAQGTGLTSRLLSALDWVMSNRTTYNIRVVNMSLGSAAIDSSQNDPTCKAVRRLVNAGIVVVAAAGNNGQNSSGQKIYGQIHSPGIEPSALTVGASNSYGTDGRVDDTMTTYSSRGPTRGYSTDSNGVKHYDNLIKPDIVAPGNKIVDAEAVNNGLVTQHPELDAAVSSVDNRKMMRLSGTSMATPVAAGAAALVLQANPKLTPNMVKAILMYTAQPLAPSMFIWPAPCSNML